MSVKVGNLLPVGTVVKLQKADKRVVIMGIFQQVKDEKGITQYDYAGVPYPEGFLGENSILLFQHEDIEIVFSLGYSDIERQQTLARLAQLLAKEDEETNK